MFWKQRSGRESTPRTSTPPRRPAEDATANPLLAPVPVLRTSLGRDTRVSGRLSFTAPTRIDGQLRGEVRASDLLVVGEHAVVEGTVRAHELVVLGEVEGDVRGAQRVEIGAGGCLRGSIEAHSLVVRAGGHFDGDCRVAPRPALRVLRAAEKAAGDNQ